MNKLFFLVLCLTLCANAEITSPDWTYITPSYDGRSDPWVTGDLIVGDGGEASLTIDNGFVVNSTWSVVGGNAGGIGVVTVAGPDSVWYAEENLFLKADGGTSGKVNIFFNGLVKVKRTENIVKINGTSEILMKAGGQLAIFGAETTSLAAFYQNSSSVKLVEGTDNLKYWDGMDFVTMANGTEDTDYFLTDGTDDLAGYGVLTVAIPEPTTMSLLALGALAMLRRRRRA